MIRTTRNMQPHSMQHRTRHAARSVQHRGAHAADDHVDECGLVEQLEEAVVQKDPPVDVHPQPT